MIGLDIRVENEYNNYLYKIFNGINLSNYVWQIITEDILYRENGELKESLFKSNVLSGEEFFKYIFKDSYYLIFADIKAYPVGNEPNKRIENINDFLKSGCEFIFLCTDSKFLEFYSKDKEVLDKVYKNCIDNKFEEVKYMSIEDVSERSMIAW